MNIKVKDCHNCPFCNNDSEYGYSCNLDDNIYDMTAYEESYIPKECPLLKGLVAVYVEHDIQIR